MRHSTHRALGYRVLGPEQSPYQPCIDILGRDVPLATLYWDDEPPFGFDVDADGRPDFNRPVSADLDQPTGWCWFFSDGPHSHNVFCAEPPQSLEVALTEVRAHVEQRLDEKHGAWEPKPRPWTRLP